MKLILHVGLAKTASSYIQNLLRINEKVLDRDGFFYPTADLPPENKFEVGNAKPFSKALYDGDEALAKELFLRYLNEGKNTYYHSMVLSHEGLSYAIRKISDELFFWFKRQGVSEIICIIVVRNLYEWLFSFYKQRCQSGYSLTVDKFLYEENHLNSLGLFLNYGLEQDGISLKAINYDKYKSVLGKRFFYEVYQIASRECSCQLKLSSKHMMNKSLTFKEVRIVQFLANINRRLASRTSKFFKSNSSRKKNDHNGLTSFRRHFDGRLNQEVLDISTKFREKLGCSLPTNYPC